MSLLDHLVIVLVAAPLLALLLLFNTRNRDVTARRAAACERGHCACRAAYDAMSDRTPQEETPR
jgi:hypothetical protein